MGRFSTRGRKPHIEHAAEGQPEVVAQRVGRDALRGELGEAGVEGRRELVAVVVVGGEEAGGLVVLGGRVEGAAGSWLMSIVPPGMFQ